MIDFFVSYTKDDADWAQWIAWQLEAAGFKTVLQAWDFPAGSDFINCMDQASQIASRVMPIFSKAYFESAYAMLEWRRYQRKDPSGNQSLIVPVRVRPGEIECQLDTRVFIDLLDIVDAEEASNRLIRSLRALPKLEPRSVSAGESRFAEHLAKPEVAPSFPSPSPAEFAPGTPRIDYTHLRFLRVLEGAEDELFSIAFSPDGRWIAAGSNGAVLLWDRADLASPETISLRTPETEATEEHGKYVYSVAFSHDSRRLVTGCEDGFVRVWDIATRKFHWQEKRHQEAVYSVAFSPDGLRLASGSYDKQVRLWDAKRGVVTRSSATDFGDIGRVTSVAFSPDGSMLAVGSLDDTVRLWNISDGSARIVGRHESSVEGVAFSPDGRLLASCGLDKAVRVWDPQKADEPLLWVRKKHEYLVRSVAFSPDSKTVASVGWDKTLILWDVESKVNFWTMPLADPIRDHWHSDWVWSVAFSPDGRQLASSGSDSQIIVWQVEAAPADLS